MRRFTSFLMMVLLFAISSTVKAQSYEYGKEITSIDEIKDGLPFIMAKGDQFMCFPDAQNASMKDLAGASSSHAFFFKLEAPQPIGETAVPEEIADKYIIRVLDKNKGYYNFWGVDNSWLNNAGWITFSMTLKNQYGQDKLYGGVWDLQYVEGEGWTLYNIGFGGYVNNAGGTNETAEYWTLYKAEVDPNDPVTLSMLSNKVATANNLKASTMGSTALNNLETAISAANEATKETVENLYNQIVEAIHSAEASIAFYEAVKPFVEAMEALDESGKTRLEENTECQSVIDAFHNNSLDETKDIVNSIKADVYAAVKAQSAGASMTFAIINPSFETGTLEGWTSTDGGNVATNYNFDQRTGEKFVERWTSSDNGGKLSDGSLLQTLTGMPNGKYTLTAEMQNKEQGNSDAPGTGFYLVANDDKTAVATHGETVTVSTVVTDNTLTIGTKLIECSGNWVCEDNFQLTYNGPVATDEELAPLTAEIANAKLLGVDVTAWEGKTYTASEIDAAVKAIKVAEYNTVIAAYPMNAGTLIPAFDAWEGGMAANKGQHWDGTLTSTYYEQAGDEWGKDSWTNSKTTTVTLPKGKYVIYAAGRNSAGGACSSYIKVNETTQIFPANGDTGFGIATDGTATFDPSATYANNNVGRGFEYRFIAFEVTADEGEDITLTVGGEATAAKQWMSICTPVLLTTSDNSAIAKQVLTSDIAAAQAIVDAKAGVGEGLFLIPEEAFNTFAAAVDAAKTANENPEATTEEINTAIAELAAAKETYKNTPVNAPAADKQYTLSLQTADETSPFELSIATDKISIETAGTPVTFVTQENGTYALSNGTEYVAYQGGNTWSLTASADVYGWTIAAVEGGYTITGKNGFLGTNTKDGAAAGSTCYGNKKATDGFYIWTISEYVTPVEPTTYAITVAEGIENGAITTDVAEAEEGATVTITATPAEGYKLESISVKNGEEDVEVSAENTFVMPAAPVTISATFVEDAVEPDPNLIEIAQTIDDNTPVDGFTNQATKNVTEDYTEYTFKENISLAFKMLNVDVKDCDYVVIKFAEPTPAGLKASFVEGEGNEEIPEGVTEWKNIIADNTTVKDGIIPQITLLTIFGPAGKSVKVEGVYKHKVASEPELATVENMTLTVAEDAVIEDEDKTFPVVFGYKAIVDESISPMASMSVTYKVTANGEEILSETFAGIDIAKETQNIWIKNMEYGKTYTVTITSVSVSYFDLETFGDNVAYTKTFAEDELTATFTTNAIPVSIDGINAAAKSNRKVVENGRVVIYKNGVKTMSSGVSIR